MSDIPLLPHQEIARDFLVSRPFAAAWLGVGHAKTRTTLQALSEIRPAGHILVIAPLAIARSSWTAEIDKWGFRLRTQSLVVGPRGGKLSAPARRKLYEQIPHMPATMFFINQEQIAALVEAFPRWPFPTVVIDEAQTFKSPDSVRVKALMSVRPQITRLIELTGTPSPQDLMDLWSQIYLLDEGRALGANFYEFRSRYFMAAATIMRRDSRGREKEEVIRWEERPGAREAIFNAISHLAISAEAANLPMPEVTHYRLDVHLDPPTMAAYQDFARSCVLELGIDPANPVTIQAKNAAVLHGKLMGFASGSMYTGEDHDKDFIQVHTAKLAMLEGLIGIAPGPVMVAYRFRADAHLIKNHLASRDIRAEMLDGSPEMIARWNARQIPVLLIQPAAHGRGLNLQFGSRDLVWYTLPDSSEHYQQTNGRLVRIGDTTPVRIYSLVTAATVDARQPMRLAGKVATQDSLVESVRAEITSLGIAPVAQRVGAPA